MQISLADYSVYLHELRVSCTLWFILSSISGRFLNFEFRFLNFKSLVSNSLPPLNLNKFSRGYRSTTTTTTKRRRRRKKNKNNKNNAQLAVQYSIGPCLKVWYCHRPALFDCRLHSGMDQYMPVYRSSPEWCSTAGASLFRIISPVISGNRLLFQLDTQVTYFQFSHFE